MPSYRTGPISRRTLATAVFVCGCVGLASPTAASAPDGACTSAVVTAEVPPTVPVLDWSENLTYDRDGNLWVARIHRNEVQRYNRDGDITATVRVESPGAVRQGPDGLIYVVDGVSQFRGVPGGVVRFDPAQADPQPARFASGLTLPNGAAFDESGALYVATSVGVVRIRQDGTADDAWSAQVRFNANGIAIHDDTMFVTSNGGPLGRVFRFPVSAPSARAVLADLSSPIPGVPDFADDLIVDENGTLYVTTLSGQLIRLTAGGDACSVLTAEPLTALAAVPGSPGELDAGTERGAILRIRLA